MNRKRLPGLVALFMLLFVLGPSTRLVSAASTALCDVSVIEGICCSQYSSDYRWPSGNGMCCNAQPYLDALYCPSSAASCDGISCPSGCGAGNVARSNGWCSDGSCNYYVSDCDERDGCVGDAYVNYYCGTGGGCDSASDSCSDCDCADDGGVQQKCGGYDIQEKVLNKNCFDGKDNDCDGKCDSSGCAGLPPDPKCGLLIESMDDIKKYCPYGGNAGNRTYSCTGWENIYVTGDIGLPSVNCGYTRACRTDGVLSSCQPTNIFFKANNEFTARNFYATNPGVGGSITIEAKKITAASLNTYGSTCSSSSCNCGGPFCGSNSGGPITLTGDAIDIGTINANDGAGVYGGGGTITITGNDTRVSNIYSSGAGYSCSYDYGYTNGPGSGGYVNIKSKRATLGQISLSGGGSSYAGGGGSGGAARLEVGNLTLDSIYATGAYRCGSGGSVTILNERGQFIGTLSTGGHSCGSNGWFRIGSDFLKAGAISTSGGSGGSAKVYLDLYNISSLASSYVAFVTNNSPQDRAFISAGTLVFGPRTKGAIIGFNTSIPDTSAQSFQLRMKDQNGTYVKSYGLEWHEEGTITPPGKVSKEIGRDFPITGFNSGKKYTLALTTSTDVIFDPARCSSGAATCGSYDVGFVEWS